MSLAEQRIPRFTKTARVGSSNLSTPAISKALAEMLEPFSFHRFKTRFLPFSHYKMPLFRQKLHSIRICFLMTTSMKSRVHSFGIVMRLLYTSALIFIRLPYRQLRGKKKKARQEIQPHQ